MGVEFELKYTMTEDLPACICREYAGQWEEIAMETTYYDTPLGVLGARRYTLRRRLENGVSVCTVKTPAPDGGRGEWEVEETEIGSAIPKLCKLGAPEELLFLTAGDLCITSGARFTRLAKSISLPDATLELALDQGVLLGGGREAPFSEVEAELKEGSEDSVRAFAADLAARFALTEETRSKHARAMLLAQSHT